MEDVTLRSEVIDSIDKFYKVFTNAVTSIRNFIKISIEIMPISIYSNNATEVINNVI